MNRRIYTQSCTVSIGSMTQAIAARNVLSLGGIRTEIVSIDPSQRTRGCAYALNFPCEEEGRLKRMLKNAGIRYHTIHRGGAR